MYVMCLSNDDESSEKKHFEMTHKKDRRQTNVRIINSNDILPQHVTVPRDFGTSVAIFEFIVYYIFLQKFVCRLVLIKMDYKPTVSVTCKALQATENMRSRIASSVFVTLSHCMHICSPSILNAFY